MSEYSNEGIKLVNQELMEVYERLIKKEELHEEAIKFWNLIRNLGIALISIPIIYIFVSSTLNLPAPGNVVFGTIIIGFLTIVIGQKIIERRTVLAPFSIEEEEFLDVVQSLEDIETFQKEGFEYSRVGAADRLSAFEEELTEPEFKDELWKNLTKEANENMHLLKQNFKERLIPSITQGKEEDINKAYLIIEKFAKYLLNPTVSEVKDLNKSMSELSSYPPEKSRLIPFFGHPYMRHVYILIIFGVSAIFTFYLSRYLGSTNDTAITNGFYIFGAFMAGYMALIIRKS